MKKRVWILFVLLVAFIAIGRSCQLSDERIRKGYWQQLDDAGCPGWGDFLFPDGSYCSLRNDTIFFGDTAIAEVLSARFDIGGRERMHLRIFCSGNDVEFIAK